MIVKCVWYVNVQTVDVCGFPCGYATTVCCNNIYYNSKRIIIIHIPPIYIYSDDDDIINNQKKTKVIIMYLSLCCFVLIKTLNVQHFLKLDRGSPFCLRYKIVCLDVSYQNYFPEGC